MRYIHITIVLLLACACGKEPVPISPPPQPEQPINVLILTETEGFRHTSIDAGVDMFLQHREAWDMTVEVTEDSKRLLNNTDSIDVLVLLSTTGDYLSDTEQMALQNYVRGGGSILGVHAATDAEYNWPWYGQMLGAQFDSHPAIQQADCIKEVADNLTEGLPMVWTRTDEWYNFKNLQAGNSVLITIDESSYTGGTNGNMHPMVWSREFEGGRVFYTAMGHTEASYSEDLFIRHIENGIKWLTEK